MRRRLPPLNALKAFEAAGRHGSFTRAADELCVTHGAVSRQIQALEVWLGSALFERHNRRVLLTPAGESYLAEVGAALDRIALATANQIEKGPPRLLRVNALGTFALRWLLPRLSSFQVANPGIEVRLITSNLPLVEEAGTFDVAVRGGPSAWPGLVGLPFLPERRIPVCSQGLLRRLPLGEPSDLRHHTLLHAATLPEIWPQWLSAAGVPDLEPKGRVTLEHFYLTIQAALDGLGVAIGPERLITDDVALGRLTMPFSGPFLPARSYHLYVPEVCAEDPAVRAFRSWIIEAGKSRIDPRS